MLILGLCDHGYDPSLPYGTGSTLPSDTMTRSYHTTPSHYITPHDTIRPVTESIIPPTRSPPIDRPPRPLRPLCPGGRTRPRANLHPRTPQAHFRRRFLHHHRAIQAAPLMPPNHSPLRPPKWATHQDLDRAPTRRRGPDQLHHPD